jgi:hypothetical protein
MLGRIFKLFHSNRLGTVQLVNDPNALRSN